MAASVQRMQKEGIAVPDWVSRVASGAGSFYAGSPAARTYFDVASRAPKPLPTDRRGLTLEVIKSEPTRVIKKNLGASLVDLGDGALGVEVHTKMNTIDGDVIAMLNEGVREAEKNFEALVISNDGQHFGAGANLFMIFAATQQKKFDQIGEVIRGLQNALQGLRYAKVPVVAAPFQYTLGGGAELAMAADQCQAHAETYMGLVELGVGLIPAGGGCLRMVERLHGRRRGREGRRSAAVHRRGLAATSPWPRWRPAARRSQATPRSCDRNDGIILNRADLLYAPSNARSVWLAPATGRRRAGLHAAAGYDAGADDRRPHLGHGRGQLRQPSTTR